MKRVARVVFDDWLQGSGSYVTSAQLNGLMAVCDIFAVQLVVFNPSAVSGTLTATIEHSGDGYLWSTLIPGSGAVNARANTSFVVYNNGSLPALPFVRVNLSLVTVTAAHVKAYFTGRDKAIRYNLNAACVLIKSGPERGFQAAKLKPVKQSDCERNWSASRESVKECEFCKNDCVPRRMKSGRTRAEAEDDCAPFCNCRAWCSGPLPADVDPAECRPNCLDLDPNLL